MKQQFHLVGIAGIGMSGLATLLIERGYQVSGSDPVSNVFTHRLEEQGARIFTTQDAAQVQTADVLVVSSAIAKDNPEYVAALARGIPIIHRVDLLRELMKKQRLIAVAGTHGKTTTTSLLTRILLEAKWDPSYAIGGELLVTGTNAHVGTGEYFVMESDESDASFLKLEPEIVIVTNIDDDHMITYGHDIEKLKEAFLQFINRLPSHGLAVVCSDDPAIKSLLERIRVPYITYGIREAASVNAKQIRAMGLQMMCEVRGECNFSAILNMPGKHNVLNALAAIAVADRLGIPTDVIQSALASFEGVGKRFNVYDAADVAGKRVTLVNDYGHHPTEIEVTLSAARQAFPGRRIVLVFQPHRYSRTRDLFSAFCTVLAMADVLLLMDVYAASEVADPRFDSIRVLPHIQLTRKFYASNKDVLAMLVSIVKEDDVVICQGAGDVQDRVFYPLARPKSAKG